MQPNEQLPNENSQSPNLPPQTNTESITPSQTTPGPAVTQPTQPEVVAPTVSGPTPALIQSTTDAAVTQPAVNQTIPTPTPPTPNKGVKKIGMVPAVIIALVLLLGASAAAYVGVVVPNKPENVWNTAVKNTAKGMDKLTAYTEQQKEIKGAKTNGSFKLETKSGVKADGTFQGSYYGSESNTTASMSVAGSKVQFDLLTHKTENADSPDIYMRVNGLDGLSSVLGATDPSTAKFLSTIDNQWYYIDHTVVDKALSSVYQADKQPTLSPDDVIAIEKAINDVNRQYLFTTDESKSVLKVSSFVGKEKVDDRTMYHYKVTVNKENTKSYLTALTAALKQTKLSEMYKDQDLGKALGLDELSKSVDNIKDDETADVWIDAKTKLFRKVRLTDNESKSHVDFSLNYNGGDTYPFAIGLYSDDEKDRGSVVLSLELNTAKNSVALGINADIASTGKGNMKVNVEKSDSTVEFTKPADAKSVMELLGPLLPSLGSEIPTSVLGIQDINGLTQ